MVPSVVKWIDDFPKTANGKLDKLKLANEYLEAASEVQPTSIATTTVFGTVASPKADVDKKANTNSDVNDNSSNSMVNFIQQAVHTISGYSPSPSSSWLLTSWPRCCFATREY
jgi:hypothetical protein